jgi:hypothetical protein
MSKSKSAGNDRKAQKRLRRTWVDEHPDVRSANAAIEQAERDARPSGRPIPRPTVTRRAMRPPASAKPRPSSRRRSSGSRPSSTRRSAAAKQPDPQHRRTALTVVQHHGASRAGHGTTAFRDRYGEAITMVVQAQFSTDAAGSSFAS